MTTSSGRKLTVDHIRYATPTQIGKLINKNPNTVSRWNRRGFVTSKVEIGYSCIDREALITGLLKRRQDSQNIEEFQKEFDEILDSSEKIHTPASA